MKIRSWLAISVASICTFDLFGLYWLYAVHRDASRSLAQEAGSKTASPTPFIVLLLLLRFVPSVLLLSSGNLSTLMKTPPVLTPEIFLRTLLDALLFLVIAWRALSAVRAQYERRGLLLVDERRQLRCVIGFFIAQCAIQTLALAVPVGAVGANDVAVFTLTLLPNGAFAAAVFLMQEAADRLANSPAQPPRPNAVEIMQ